MKQLVIYIHGKGGSADEAKHYRRLFPRCDVVGLEYTAKSPWEAKEEFPPLFDRLSSGYSSVTLIANSIGAYFAMSALSKKNINEALFISPIVDMEKLILNMMARAGVTESELEEKKEIKTDTPETLSWEYLSYVREHTIKWTIPTRILYGGKDNLTAWETISDFAEETGASLTVMEDGEHWFHTERQMKFLDYWIADKA